MDWFLYDNGLRHERVKSKSMIFWWLQKKWKLINLLKFDFKKQDMEATFYVRPYNKIFLNLKMYKTWNR